MPISSRWPESSDVGQFRNIEIVNYSNHSSCNLFLRPGDFGSLSAAWAQAYHTAVAPSPQHVPAGVIFRLDQAYTPGGRVLILATVHIASHIRLAKWGTTMLANNALDYIPSTLTVETRCLSSDSPRRGRYLCANICDNLDAPKFDLEMQLSICLQSLSPEVDYLRHDASLGLREQVKKEAKTLGLTHQKWQRASFAACCGYLLASPITLPTSGCIKKI